MAERIKSDLHLGMLIAMSAAYGVAWSDGHWVIGVCGAPIVLLWYYLCESRMVR